MYPTMFPDGAPPETAPLIAPLPRTEEARLREQYDHSPNLFAEQARGVDAEEEKRLREQFPTMYPAQEAHPNPTGDAQPAAGSEAAAFELPQGMDPQDPGVAAFRQLATEARIDGPRATKLLQMHRESMQRSVQAAFAAEQEQWEQAGRADAELGGNAYEGNRQFVIDLVRRHGSAEMADALGQVKAMHPDLLRLLVRLGRALEDA